MTPGNPVSIDVPAADPGDCIEEGQRLSESVLWKLQREYFAEYGERAWSEGDVPHYVTSNRFIADAYANAIFGFLRDSNAAGVSFVRIVELGAGVGRLAFHVLKRLTRLYRGSVLSGRIAFKYVMSDMSERTVAYWKQHASLFKFVDSGVLEFARFDIQNGGARELLGGNDPVVLVANYFFDSIPTDAFRVRGGRLLELLIRLDGNARPALDNLLITYAERETSTSYYPEPHFNRILAYYTGRLGDTSLLFPIAALRCLQEIRAALPKALLVLTADHGQIQEDELLDCTEPCLLHHGSVSLGVNYHALNLWAADAGGEVLLGTHRHRRLAVCAWLWGAGNECVETRKACEAMLAPFGPDDFFTLKEGIESHASGFSAEQLLAYCRMSHYDSRAFINCLPALSEMVLDYPAGFEKEVWQLVNRVWDEYFPIGEADDLARGVGDLLLRMKLRAEALQFFERSLALYGRTSATLVRMARCRWEMRETGAARSLIDEVLQREPGHDYARTLLVRMEASS